MSRKLYETWNVTESFAVCPLVLKSLKAYTIREECTALGHSADKSLIS